MGRRFGNCATLSYYFPVNSNLRENGYVEDYNAAFSKYLSRGKPGYVERAKTSIHEATSAILKAKGIPVLAHPGRYKLNEWEFDSMFKEFTEAGGHAIEVTTRRVR